MRHDSDRTEIGTEDYDYIMMMLVSMSNSGLFVFPTHRLVKNLEKFDETMLIGFLTEDFSASKIYFVTTIVQTFLTRNPFKQAWVQYSG